MQSYDFIIVGAGSAGCALAERLTASGRHSVLLLEAGGSDRRFFIDMPLGYGKTFFDTAVNWAYRTDPDAGLAGQSDYWPRGKVLGGSSSINAMVWMRGAREDYEDWRAAGNPGWGYDDLLDDFKAIEDYEGGADRWRGVGGPVHVSRIDRSIHPLTRRYLEAAQMAGLSYNDDFNGEGQEGVGIYQFTIKRGRRVSSSSAFLRPTMRRANLRVETRAQASRILFEGTRAVGIEYHQNGQTKQARAGREVILSGGAVNSPQLLQLSGIGPADLLAAHGIPVVAANANVGQHLADHQGINYTWRSKVPTLNQALRPWWGKLKAGIEYLALRSGPLSMSINQGAGFFRTSPDEPRPNMQLYFQAFSTVIPKPGERPILNPDPWPGFSIGLSNCRTFSRGHVAIASADPFAPPRIVANAFSHEKDVADMLAAVRFLRVIAAQKPMAEIIDTEILPGASLQADADLIADFRKRSGTVYHPCSTCRMGPDASANVVDSRLRVHGVSGLRVADASVFPTLIAGNTNAAAIVTGWKAGRMIQEDCA
jgi:choline dehydrogenase